jgi:hypothetical protein
VGTGAVEVGGGAVAAGVGFVLGAGDAGGAPVLANVGRGDWSVYDDARELLAAVAALLGGKQ